MKKNKRESKWLRRGKNQGKKDEKKKQKKKTQGKNNPDQAVLTYVDGFSHGGGDEVHGLFESVRVAGTRVQNVNAHRDVRKQTRVRVDFLSKERENQTRNEETKDQGKVNKVGPYW